MSLRTPRRIFARRKRLSADYFGLRTFAVLAFGFTAAFGASVVAERRSVAAAPAGQVLHLAAAGPQHEGKVFFSEEKNQKTFMSAPAARYRPWPANGEAAGK